MTPITRAGTAMATSEPARVRALRLRSEALNKQYGLGAWELEISPAPEGANPPGSARCAFEAKR